MRWIVQSDLSWERAHHELGAVLERFGLPHDFVRCAGGAFDVPPVDGDAVVVGSMALVRRALASGVRPGAWADPETFDHRACVAALGDLALNADATVLRLSEVTSLRLPAFFVRPVADDKSLNGSPMTAEGFAAWRATKAGAAVPGDTLVAVAPLRLILTETRFAVVDGRPVTGSVYRRGGRVAYDPLVDDRVLDFAREVAAAWTPGRACALDIAQTPEGPRVVEFNCLNSAGWYACDVARIVDAVESMS